MKFILIALTFLNAVVFADERVSEEFSVVIQTATARNSIENVSEYYKITEGEVTTDGVLERTYCQPVIEVFSQPSKMKLVLKAGDGEYFEGSTALEWDYAEGKKAKLTVSGKHSIKTGQLTVLFELSTEGKQLGTAKFYYPTPVKPYQPLKLTSFALPSNIPPPTPPVDLGGARRGVCSTEASPAIYYTF